MLWYSLYIISFHIFMLTQLKKIVAVMAVFATAIALAPIAGAFTLTAPSGSNNSSGSSAPASTVNTTQYCDIYGCSNVGGNGSTGTANNGNNGNGNGNNGNGGTANNPSNPCDVYGCSNANGGSTGSTGTANNGSNGSTGTANVPSNPCDIYIPCNGSMGTNGTGTANTPSNPCDIYTNCNPGSSQCNNHVYPNDIDGHWAEIYIRRLYDLCVFEGYSDGSFRPDQSITRAELTKVALSAAGIQPNPGCYNTSCGSPFSDLDMWQGPWVRPAWDRRIVQGWGSTFAPNQPITRAEATKIIMSAFGYSPTNVDKSFFNDVSGWSTGWIETAHNMGIVSGIGNGNFDPDRPITRAEAAKILVKTLEKWDTHIANNNNNNFPYATQQCPASPSSAWQNCMHQLYPNQY